MMAELTGTQVVVIALSLAAVAGTTIYFISRKPKEEEHPPPPPPPPPHPQAKAPPHVTPAARHHAPPKTMPAHKPPPTYHPPVPPPQYHAPVMPPPLDASLQQLAQLPADMYSQWLAEQQHAMQQQHPHDMAPHIAHPANSAQPQQHVTYTPYPMPQPQQPITYAPYPMPQSQQPGAFPFDPSAMPQAHFDPNAWANVAQSAQHLFQDALQGAHVDPFATASPLGYR